MLCSCAFLSDDKQTVPVRRLQAHKADQVKLGNFYTMVSPLIVSCHSIKFTGLWAGTDTLNLKIWMGE